MALILSVVISPRSASGRPDSATTLALCPDCDGAGQTLVPFAAALTMESHDRTITETAALRRCVICRGRGWYRLVAGR